MSYIARTDYCCAVNTQKEYTSFRWDLPDFSLLKEYYKNVKSSDFTITNTEARCSLDFIVRENIPKSEWASEPTAAAPYVFGAAKLNKPATASVVAASQADEFAYVNVNFWHQNTFDKMKVIVSIVNSAGTKVLTQSKTGSFVGNHRLLFRLIDTSTMLNPMMSSTYLHNDTLTILCEIINIKNQESAMTDTKTRDASFSNEVQNKLQAFFDTKSFCDVVFAIGEREFHGHKVILAANSPVFEAMFSTDMTERSEKRVDISDIDVATFEAFLKYIYTGSIGNMEEIVGDLLIVADKYQVMSLRNLCETYIADRLAKANAIEYLLLAYLHNFETLKTKALTFVRSCQQEIVESSEFKKLCTYPELVSEIFRKPL